MTKAGAETLYLDLDATHQLQKLAGLTVTRPEIYSSSEAAQRFSDGAREPEARKVTVVDGNLGIARTRSLRDDESLWIRFSPRRPHDESLISFKRAATDILRTRQRFLRAFGIAELSIRNVQLIVDVAVMI